MRDLEDLMLGTMCIKISQITGIPTGRVLAKMPDFSLVNKYDGSNQPSVNDQKFPSVGMRYFNDVKYKINVYGDKPIAVKSLNEIKIYEPLGEIHVPLSIYLFTNTRKEQRLIGNQIMFELARNSHYYTIDDPLPNQYFSVEYNGHHDTDQHRPYVKVFNVVLCGQVFSESTGFVVDAIETNIQTSNGSLNHPIENVTNTILGTGLLDSEYYLSIVSIDDEDVLLTENSAVIVLPISNDP
jgi:hypothetical protein